ncbi:TIM-barrel domain-containing protein [Formosa algae]|uniref:Alpha-D-xyloside xylohydrolase n=1 Tax=Formosa algae TaxID=225843 RepID=A0A9X0YNN7_9FLAO|nr:TIM-barrel domain-containing protein [Formosa algae]MBP1841258.1 alpha-D-xyloside xylohydrolase [Formosa algae]MDQ0336819.1 alpha-D-xyloside xylohydrolase [Formosa algae]
MNYFKTISICSLFLCAMLLASCQSSFKHKIEKSEHGLTIHQDSTLITIEVVNASIIHVNKIKIGSTPTELPDYVTVLEPQDVTWDVKESSDVVTISTDALQVIVNSKGIIEYKTLDNKNLVSETDELTYIHPKDTVHSVSQAFEAGDEALYGLGQFQSGIMNWKHVPIRLQQYNQEIAVPFLVSTKGYGIYWHNYSLTDFNLPQNKIEFKSTSEMATTEKVVVPEDGEKENVAAYAVKEAAEKNIRETTFTPSNTGEYTFLALSDNDGRMRGEIKVTIDDDPIINYSTIWMPRRYSGKKYLEAGKTYKVVFQNTGAKIPGTLLYNTPDYNKTVFSSTRGHAIDYYVVQGDNPAEVISEYQKLTGTAPMFAKSAYGFWQCRERYHNQEELLANAREMRERKIPFDNIVQDWFYWPKGTKGPEWDPAKYPDPDAMVDELKALNLKLMVSVWPEVKNQALEAKYNLDKIESSNYVDIYDKGVSERFYRMLSDSMFHKGVSSIWLDGTEPEGVFNTKVNTAIGPYESVQNPYSLEVNRAMYEGRRAEFPNERVFNLTRSAYAGQQRYGATSWSGDVEASWEQFSEQIAAGLNFTMAGIPYWTHDIGGFFRDSKSINPEFDSQYTNPEFIELLTRWFQFGTFSPIFRIHGYVSETEIWRYDAAFESTARKFIDLRYQLMPYIYSQAWQITTNSKQLMTPLAYHYPNDKNTWQIKDQLFFGESLMVGFVTEYEKRQKEMYFPKGEWYNFWTNEKIHGGTRKTVKAELNETPLFVKAGSILPIGPKVQYATQKTDEPLRLKIYPGADATFTLYFDDSETYDYETGEYSELKLSYSEANKTLQITKGNGEYLEYSKTPMTFVVEMIGGAQQTVSFEGSDLEVKL